MLRGLCFCLLSAFLVTFTLLELPAIIYYAFGLTPFSSSLLQRNPSPPPSHPIPQLIKEAEEKFEGLLLRQSTSLESTVAEYRRRYNRDPPKGFDEWYAFAEANDVRIIDEYDSMVRELEPFWRFSGEEFRRRVEQVGQLPSIDVVRLINGSTVTLNVTKKFHDSEDHARAKGFRVMIEKFQKKLPDMDFPINAKAESR
ncbi:glycosyltransferase family 90 protein, partial [Sphaerobolus stellatus SS14]